MVATGLAALAPWVVLTGAIVALLIVDLFAFSRGREPTFRAGAVWSLGWLLVSLAAGVVVLAVADGLAAVNYTTVYLIERSLSLDNLFVFLLLFAYFGVPGEHRAKLLFWGIVAALVLRGLAILGGVALVERFHFVVYVLGAALLLLAYRILRGMDENVDPERNLLVRAVRRLYPVDADVRQGRWFVRRGGVRHVTPLFLCLVSIVVADITFAVDSIPAAFAITREPLLIWMGNAFALLGLRALFVLVEWLIRRFRYLDQTIAIVLALVAVKLLLEDVYDPGPLVSLAVVAAAFVCGIVVSIVADRRDPLADEKRGERDRRVTAAHTGSTR
jgi:tellurite resistance protein TerC